MLPHASHASGGGSRPKPYDTAPQAATADESAAGSWGQAEYKGLPRLPLPEDCAEGWRMLLTMLHPAKQTGHALAACTWVSWVLAFQGRFVFSCYRS